MTNQILNEKEMKSTLYHYSLWSFENNGRKKCWSCSGSEDDDFEEYYLKEIMPEKKLFWRIKLPRDTFVHQIMDKEIISVTDSLDCVWI
jgi:hypothetical protein